MKKIISVSLLISLLSLSFFSVHQENNENDTNIASPGLVAYAASYSSDYKDEAKYSTQKSKTFDYLNLGDTLDYYRGDSIKVGIIDSGINYDHEDFMVNDVTKVKGSSKYYSYQNSGWVYYGATEHGYSYINDTLGHGTNVAATIAAAINGVGGLGLAPNVELYIYKVTNAQNGYEFGAIQLALSDAVSLKLDVINMSFQSYEHEVSYNSSSMGASSGCSTMLTSYLNSAYNAGITLVGAAGNFNTNEPSYPGSNNHVINVGSLNTAGNDKAPFSNYGNTIDLVAPGYVYVADEANNAAYTSTQGTSFSAPLVTAAIALYKQKHPNATPSEIETALYNSCDEIDDSASPYTNWAGHGKLNVARFLEIEEEGNAPTEIIINNPEVVNEELSLDIGDNFSLDWTVNGNGTFSDEVNIYPFEDNGTFSVSEEGIITALNEGNDYLIIESVQDDSVYASIYITVNAPTPRSVIEMTTVSDQITWPSSATPTITKENFNSLTATTSGKTVYESSSMRLGTGSGGGTLTIDSSNKKINLVDIYAKYYSSNYSSSVLRVGEQSISSLTANYVKYQFNLGNGVNNLVISTSSSSSRVNIQKVVVYNVQEVDISQSKDCLGLETFINNYLHMDYIENLGYCKDNEHHYYLSAKTAFNNLNAHQRTLFTSNNAYDEEWNRLSTWANINGDSLGDNNLLSTKLVFTDLVTFNDNKNQEIILIILIASISSIVALTIFLYIKRRKKD